MNENVLKDIGLIWGTASMTPKQIEQLGTLLPASKSFSVLEFGAGKSSELIFNSLKKKYEEVKYITYETNSRYAPTCEGITVRMHTVSDLVSGKVEIPKSEKYDLVIVDGPDGEVRQYWYSLFKDNVKKGTIIHVDDAFHYASFEEELNKYFTELDYAFVSKLGEEQGNKCWITGVIQIN
ncbi:MAG: hypothetical protein CME38_13165 [Haliea sp.]|nr:hypothetical protein [Haliea sp.]|tara:strand:- start:1157 stop:1696 length:540 start_codon:yes stop_codon:yes gene_type:complete